MTTPSHPADIIRARGPDAVIKELVAYYSSKPLRGESGPMSSADEELNKGLLRQLIGCGQLEDGADPRVIREVLSLDGEVLRWEAARLLQSDNSLLEKSVAALLRCIVSEGVAAEFGAEGGEAAQCTTTSSTGCATRAAAWEALGDLVQCVLLRTDARCKEPPLQTIQRHLIAVLEQSLRDKNAFASACSSALGADGEEQQGCLRCLSLLTMMPMPVPSGADATVDWLKAQETIKQLADAYTSVVVSVWVLNGVLSHCGDADVCGKTLDSGAGFWCVNFESARPTYLDTESE